jgi:His-Xaa-Ser system protein HxsD
MTNNNSQQLLAIIEVAQQRLLSNEEVAILKDAIVTRKQNSDEIEIISVNPQIYPIEAIHRTIYWFADQVSIRLIEKENAEIGLIILKSEISDERLSEIKKQITISLNDFAVRLDIETRTSSIRELLVRKAICEIKTKKAG